MPQAPAARVGMAATEEVVPAPEASAAGAERVAQAVHPTCQAAMVATVEMVGKARLLGKAAQVALLLAQLPVGKEAMEVSRDKRRFREASACKVARAAPAAVDARAAPAAPAVRGGRAAMALGYQVAGVVRAVPVEWEGRPTTPNAVSDLVARVDQVVMAALARRSVQGGQWVPTGARATACAGADRIAPAWASTPMWRARFRPNPIVRRSR